MLGTWSLFLLSTFYKHGTKKLTTATDSFKEDGSFQTTCDNIHIIRALPVANIRTVRPKTACSLVFDAFAKFEDATNVSSRL
ncbi:predicted protein [Lichtheimia corymbifera JMRC:FSU:9682]|uniref:Uncharacterized protein n=1 Tax=Lichtheimia corymbifera JMRC:FSU:9682 TaxID=1263082 RepID=A0A068RLS5_9FUNG|nr:predicted protein [Lichtheimia corymbifera JMRC:FSU:9682]